jgi:hypothetical protein
VTVFSDDWRSCLREQYKHVVRVDDSITRNSLTGVMYQVGFTDDELAQLRVEATMRVEDMPDDFVPDLNILENETIPESQPAQSPAPEFQPHPLECQCPACVEINMTPHDEEGQPIEIDEEDPDAPKQMTMF